MTYKLANSVYTTIAVAATATDTTIVVALAATPNANPPTPGTGETGVLVLQDKATNPTAIEVVTYTGVSNAGTRVSVTGVTRAQEGTTAHAFAVGAYAFGALTAGIVTKLQTDIASNTAGKLAIASNLSDLDNAATARTNLGLKSAAVVDTGTGATDVPTNAALGSASLVDTGTAAADVALNSDRYKTATQISALAADQGPLISSDDGSTWVWTGSAYSRASMLLSDRQPSMSGSATFTQATNNVKLTGIVTSLALEVGDVIQVTGAAATTPTNNGLRTVESITDDNNVILNYEHRNGAGSLSLTDETATVTVKRIAKWYNAPLGLGQAWVDVYAIRVNGTIYTPPYTRAIGWRIGGGKSYGPDAITYSLYEAGAWKLYASQSGTAPSRFLFSSVASNDYGASFVGSTPLLPSWSELR